MKRLISIDQARAVELGLNATQAALLSYIHRECQLKCRNINVGTKVYVTITREEVIQDLPLFFSKKDSVYRTFKKLHDAGIIEYRTDSYPWDLCRLTGIGKEWLGGVQ